LQEVEIEYGETIYYARVHVGWFVLNGRLDSLKGNKLFMEMRGRKILKSCMMRDG
jgi:hypothetical protein